MGKLAWGQTPLLGAWSACCTQRSTGFCPKWTRPVGIRAAVCGRLTLRGGQLFWNSHVLRICPTPLRGHASRSWCSLSRLMGGHSGRHSTLLWGLCKRESRGGAAVLSPWLGREVAKREEASHLRASAIRGRNRAVLGPPAPPPPPPHLKTGSSLPGLNCPLRAPEETVVASWAPSPRDRVGTRRQKRPGPESWTVCVLPVEPLNGRERMGGQGVPCSDSSPPGEGASVVLGSHPPSEQ